MMNLDRSHFSKNNDISLQLQLDLVLGLSLLFLKLPATIVAQGNSKRLAVSYKINKPHCITLPTQCLAGIGSRHPPSSTSGDFAFLFLFRARFRENGASPVPSLLSFPKVQLL